MIIAVKEREIMESMQTISKRGIYIEPTSAVATAGLSHLIREGIINTGESTAAVLTGSGLKATDKFRTIMKKNKKSLN